uniref:Uncharacterized protein n=1 Tax=Arundo donax TaxID=35708 RepID=A0A0A9D287_ARUDO
MEQVPLLMLESLLSVGEETFQEEEPCSSLLCKSFQMPKRVQSYC